MSTTEVGETTKTGDIEGTAIAWTGSNTVVTCYAGKSLEFFYSASGGFNGPQTVSTSKSFTLGDNFPGITVGDNTVAITDTASNGNLYWWTQAFGASGWPRRTIAE